MSDIDTIKARVKKLMAVAGNGAAGDNEIDNAVRLAARLIDAHHLNPDDYKPGDPVEEDGPPVMGRAFGMCGTSKLAKWEAVMGVAVARLFGTVQCYAERELGVLRVDGVAQADRDGNARRVKRVAFFGPDEDAREAADLFTGWVYAIAAMGVNRWGGCYKGDGAMYCYGFAGAVQAKVNEIDASRRLVQAKPVAALPGPVTTTAITLADRYGDLRKAGSAWLQQAAGFKAPGTRRVKARYDGSAEAYAEGQRHGAAAEFTRATKAKRLTA